MYLGSYANLHMIGYKLTLHRNQSFLDRAKYLKRTYYKKKIFFVEANFFFRNVYGTIRLLVRTTRRDFVLIA